MLFLRLLAAVFSGLVLGVLEFAASYLFFDKLHGFRYDLSSDGERWPSSHPTHWYELLPGFLLGLVFLALVVFAFGRIQKLPGDRAAVVIGFLGGLVPGSLASLLFAALTGMTKGVA